MRCDSNARLPLQLSKAEEADEGLGTARGAIPVQGRGSYLLAAASPLLSPGVWYWLPAELSGEGYWGWDGAWGWGAGREEWGHRLVMSAVDTG